MQQLKTRITTETLIAAGGLSLLFLCLQKGLIALGILTGALTGIVSFSLRAISVARSTTVSLQRIKPYFFVKYLVRYAIMGGVLFLCARIGRQFFLAASGGLLLIYLVIFLDTFILGKECKIQEH